MIRTRLGRASLITAGIATSGMGAFHFLLPHIFGWARFTGRLSAEIRWALFALNAFFSLLLLSGGLAGLMAVRQLDTRAAWPIWSMAVFWVFNAVYQLLWPFPTPVVRWVLFGFALTVAALYVFGLLAGAAAPRRMLRPSARGAA